MAAQPAAAGGDTARKKVLVYFLHHLLDFRLKEIESLADMIGVPGSSLNWSNALGDHEMSPVHYASFPSLEAVQKVAARSMLAKAFFEVWAEGETWEEVEASFRRCDPALVAPYTGPQTSFKVQLEPFGCRIPAAEYRPMIDRLAFVPMQGPVRLADPDVVLSLIYVDARNCGGMPADIPFRMFVCRQVAATDRSLKTSYELCRRAYIGPTSMDNEMAFIMCNMAKLRRGQLVMDPYAGTGSILVSAAHHGAVTLGADIDIRVLAHGRTDERTGAKADIYSNFDQYGLPRPAGLLRMDMARPPFRAGLEEVLDAVVGDPPYGVRAGGRKGKAVPGAVVPADRTHFPATEPYAMGECMRDLLDVSARLLRIGGRVVFFVPSVPRTYREDELPAHPALQLVANCEQALTTRYSRRLIVMEKVRKYDADAAAAFHAAQGAPVTAFDAVHEEVFEKRQKERAGEEVATTRKPFRSKMC